MAQLLFLYNIHAGKGQAKTHLAAMVDAFTRAGWLVTARPTQGPGDAAQVARALGGSFPRIICCGGDGTLHETITGLMDLPQRPVVGYIPAGSTNDFSKNLHLPRSYEAMARTAASGVPLPCDIGRFNQRYFVYVAAFGAFTDVSYDTPQQFKNMFGHLAYVLEGMARIPAIKGYQLTVAWDEGVLEDEYIFGMVSNTVSVGGFKGVPTSQVSLDDGLFEVVLVKTPRNAMQLQAIIRALLQQTPDEGGMVSSFHTARLTVTCKEALPWTLDGEYGGAPQVAEIENCAHAVTIVRGRG